MDPQSRAYREMTKKDRVADEDLPAPTDAPVRGPEWYEQGEGWDTGREAPKTVEEAERQLAARIADPTAPDIEEHRHAYREDND